jgi:hypothetical protein
MRIKSIVLMAIVVSFINVTFFNMAYAKFDSCEKWGIGCESKPDTGNVKVDIDNSNRNTNFNTNTNLNSDVNVNKVDTRVTVKPDMSNRNNQDQEQDQKQKQKQNQDQDQMQGQVQSANNNGNHQTIVFEDRIQYDHISNPLSKTHSNMKRHLDSSQIKTVSTVYDRLTIIDHKSAKRLGKATTDFKSFPEMLIVKPFQTAHITKGVKGTYMGSIVFVPTGNDITKGGLIGKALVEGMRQGATNFVMTFDDSQYLDGSKAGIDFGSAASVALNPKTGSAMLAPATTLGYSKAWSSNEYRTGLVIDLYFDDTAIIEKHDPNHHETNWIK